MTIHQIIYNSSAASLNGSSGFGIRTVSDGTPQEYIDIVNDNSSLRSYNSGKFNIASNIILNSPERIFEYPRGYYYKILQINDKQIYAIGRIVSTCFDHSFYVTGKATRSGNYVAHIFMSEEFPGKKAFNLLYETAQEEQLFFIPKNWTPIQSNTELLFLMTGKPQLLPPINTNFPEVALKYSEKSLDLLFSYRAILKEQKPIIVSLYNEITAPTVATFMNLLPESLAKETTFVINHQTEGHSKDVKISFINEYYQHAIYTNLCSHINLMSNNRQIDKLEKIWRPILEHALNNKEYSRTNLLINWIFSRLAYDNTDSPATLNEALFNYCQNPSKFTLRTIDEVDNILQVISKYVKQGDITPNHLNSLIIQMIKEASELNDFVKAINYCERMFKVGLDISYAKSYIQNRFTDFIITDPCLLYNAFLLLKDVTLRKYSITEKYPKFNNIIPEILLKQSDISQIILFAKYLENDAYVRVENYIYLLNNSPELIYQYGSLLNSDKEEAEKIDYIRTFKDHLYNPAFALLFYQQIKIEARINPSIELANKIYDLTKVNPEFSKLILKDDQIFYAIYNSVKRQLHKENYSKISKAIENNILTLLLPESRVSKQWQLLHDVLNLKLVDKKKILPFYNLAKEIEHLEALKMVAPLCFMVLEREHINDFLTLIKQYNLMTDSEIVNYVFSYENIDYQTYIIPVAKLYAYDYEKIYKIISLWEKDDKIKKRIIKDHFPKLYNQHQKDSLFNGIKALFAKKDKI